MFGIKVSVDNDMFDHLMYVKTTKEALAIFVSMYDKKPKPITIREMGVTNMVNQDTLHEIAK